MSLQAVCEDYTYVCMYISIYSYTYSVMCMPIVAVYEDLFIINNMFVCISYHVNDIYIWVSELLLIIKNAYEITL